MTETAPEFLALAGAVAVVYGRYALYRLLQSSGR